MSGCHVTLVNIGRANIPGSKGHAPPSCGKPVVHHGLCEDHYADRIRLGGTP